MKKSYIAFLIANSLLLFSCQMNKETDFETRIYPVHLHEVLKIKGSLKDYFINKGVTFSEKGYFAFDKDISRIFMTDSQANLNKFDSIIYKEPMLDHRVLIGGGVEIKGDGKKSSE